jgi:CheY-like chemotaxis protein
MMKEPQHRATIMVVEDHADSRQMLKTLLGMKGYGVIEAEDGQAAVALLEIERPDLILMDLQLPKLHGFALTRHVRLHPALALVPIIIVSGHDPLHHRPLALAAGCDEYFLKPIDFDLLERTLVRLLLPRGLEAAAL